MSETTEHQFPAFTNLFSVACNAMRVFKSIIVLVVLGCTSKSRSSTTYLDLSNRGLSAVPDSVFTLKKLKYLQLGNSFTIYPPLSALGPDSLSGKNLNQIGRIPNDVNRLTELKVLGVCYNNVENLPTEIVDLKKLDSLDISFNGHLRIAKELSILKQMRQLKYLNIIATDIDSESVDELRRVLPKTTIVSKLQDIKIDTLN